MSNRQRRQAAAERDSAAAKKDRWDLGRAGLAWGIPEASLVLRASTNKTRYWARKVLDPLFRPGRHGGVRTGFDRRKEHEVCVAIREIIEQCPTKGYQLIVDDVYRKTGHIVSRTYVATVLAICDFTCVQDLNLHPPCRLQTLTHLSITCRWKVPETKQINKYAIINMKLYATFLNWLLTVDMRRVKFLDESHFQTKGICSFMHKFTL